MNIGVIELQKYEILSSLANKNWKPRHHCRELPSCMKILKNILRNAYFELLYLPEALERSAFASMLTSLFAPRFCRPH